MSEREPCWYCGRKTRRIDPTTIGDQHPDRSCCPSHDDPA